MAPPKRHGSPEVSALAVLGQNVGACSLEVQHASIKGAIMRVSKSSASGWSRKAARTTQPRDNGRHLILGMNTSAHASTNTLSQGSFSYPRKHGQRTVLVILTAPQVSGGQRWLWQCTSPDMHVQLVQTSSSHCWLDLYAVPWYKHDALESKTHKGTHTFPRTLEANMLSVLAGCQTLALVAAFPWNLHLFLTIWTLYRWTLFNATLNVAQLRKRGTHGRFCCSMSTHFKFYFITGRNHLGPSHASFFKL